MNITRILHDLLRERDELERAIEALERLAARGFRGRRRGPGRPPKLLSYRRRYGRRRGPGRPPGRPKGRRGPGRPPGRPKGRRGPGRPPKTEALGA